MVTTNPRVALESPMSSEINEESDQDIDFVEEYDSEEERRPRRKKKVNTPNGMKLLFTHNFSLLHALVSL